MNEGMNESKMEDDRNDSMDDITLTWDEVNDGNVENELE